MTYRVTIYRFRATDRGGWRVPENPFIRELADKYRQENRLVAFNELTDPDEHVWLRTMDWRSEEDYQAWCREPVVIKESYAMKAYDEERGILSETKAQFAS